MTDEQIIKALECCTGKGKSCKECPAFVKVDRSKCRQYFIAALELIRRQQKQIDVLNTNCMSMCQSMPNMAKAERAEAIKEFADRLENRFFNYYEVLNRDSNKRDYRGETLMVYEVADMIEDCIDGTLKEMVGADNG